MDEYTDGRPDGGSPFNESNTHEHIESYLTRETDEGYLDSQYWLRVRVQVFEEDCISLQLTEEDKQRLDAIFENTPELSKLFAEIAERDNREQFSQRPQ